MLPRELPISDEALIAAEEELEFPSQAKRAIQAFLQAEGFEVEKRVSRSPSIIETTRTDPSRGTITRERLVSPWKPAPSSTEGSDPFFIAELEELEQPAAEPDTKSAPTRDTDVGSEPMA